MSIIVMLSSGPTQQQAGGVARTMPSFVAAGAGAEAATQTTDLTPAVPGSAGNYLLLHVKVRDGTVGAGSIDNQAALVTAGWTVLNDRTQNGAAVAWLFGKFHDGSESHTIQWSGENAAYARIYAYANVDPNVPVEAIATPTGSNSTAAATMPTISTITNNALAVAVLAASQDVTTGAATGESGGNWVETVAEFISNAGFDSTLQAQHATMTAAGTISGGTTALSQTTSVTVFGIGLRGAPA